MAVVDADVALRVAFSRRLGVELRQRATRKLFVDFGRFHLVDRLALLVGFSHRQLLDDHRRLERNLRNVRRQFDDALHSSRSQFSRDVFGDFVRSLSSLSRQFNRLGPQHQRVLEKSSSAEIESICQRSLSFPSSHLIKRIKMRLSPSFFDEFVAKSLRGDFNESERNENSLFEID